MARALWKGAVTFGLVSIPVEVHTAVRDSGPNFRLLRAKDKSPVRYQRIAERDDKEVAWADLVKGFEYQKGRFIVLTKKDFESAAVERDRTIDIVDFVKTEEIDDRYYDKPYYLTPGPGGDKAYVLLRETIRRAGRIGIAKFVMRDREHLAALEAIDDALVLSLLRFADELVDESTLEFPPAKGLNKKDLDTALMLVNNFGSEWDPGKYTNEYRDNLMKIIHARQKGVEAEVEQHEPQMQPKVVDLMERLRRSLEASGGPARKGGTGRSGRRTQARTRARSKRHAA